MVTPKICLSLLNKEIRLIYILLRVKIYMNRQRLIIIRELPQINRLFIFKLIYYLFLFCFLSFCEEFRPLFLSHKTLCVTPICVESNYKQIFISKNALILLFNSFLPKIALYCQSADGNNACHELLMTTPKTRL
jgi:hypothetical protein